MDTEERAARKGVARARAEAAVIRTGIGAAAIVAGLERAVRAASSGPPLVILFGVAGALADAPDAPPVDRVTDESGRVWTCSVSPPADGDPAHVSVVGVDRLVPTPAEKTALRTRTGALLVDMESHAFAAAASAAGAPFAVVRGVSDGPGHELPAQTLNWVAPDGRSRPGRFVRDVLTSPSLIPTVMRTMPQVFRGLRAASHRLSDLLSSEALARLTR